MQLTRLLPHLVLAAVLATTATAVDDESPSPVYSSPPRPATPKPTVDDESPSPVPSNQPYVPPPARPTPAGIAPRKALCAPNLDFPGFDVYNMKSGSHDGCNKLSRADPRVTSYTWTNYQGGMCWFKGAATNWKPSPGAISCRFDGASSKQVTSCDMPGGDFVSRPYKSTLLQGTGYALLGGLNKNVKDCRQHCLEDGRCYASTWSEYNGGTCWLKTSPSACKTNKNTYSDIILRQWY